MREPTQYLTGMRAEIDHMVRRAVVPDKCALRDVCLSIGGVGVLRISGEFGSLIQDVQVHLQISHD